MALKVTRREADYIKIVYEKSVEEQHKVTSGIIAKEVGVRTPTVIEVLWKLKKRKLVSIGKAGEITLTKRGLKLAEVIIRKHRILETYFVKELNLDLTFACKESSNVDYLLSSEVMDKLCSILGNPCNCPHGKPIPYKGKINEV
ncbi:MAG: metal-dependent transcriptional regulator [Thermoproteota archaeon]|nr:metal-dependent transcriptional regulator [Candidatus Brockarchaeota archaeon]MBO3768768.1 metal-dependent transcriptional regulator [Candidatus Brockarchaeota archaeon]MBO3800933.1 metal-dependent transcriptional regulator [Candidatus Brockarchaeota archaeon]